VRVVVCPICGERERNKDGEREHERCGVFLGGSADRPLRTSGEPRVSALVGEQTKSDVLVPKLQPKAALVPLPSSLLLPHTNASISSRPRTSALKRNPYTQVHAHPRRGRKHTLFFSLLSASQTPPSSSPSNAPRASRRQRWVHRLAADLGAPVSRAAGSTVCALASFLLFP
jgi:hypothetical protein